MYEIQLFDNPEFGSIRTAVDSNGEPLFCGKDIATALGYKRPADAISAHCKGVCEIPTPSNGGIQMMKYITQGDVYRLAFGSKLPSAEQFTDWVVDEVLPSIRKTGSYSISDMSDDEVLSKGYLIACKKLEEYAIKNKELTTQNEQLTEKNEELNIKTIQQEQQIGYLRPAAEYTNRILTATDLLTVTQIAKEYGVGAHTLNQWLHEVGVQYKQNGQWLLYAKYQGKGYTQSVTAEYTRPDGGTGASMQTKWTQKGREFIYRILKEKKGIVPIRTSHTNRLFSI